MAAPVNDDFPICELWLGMIMAHQHAGHTRLVACEDGHLNPPDGGMVARCPLPDCGAHSRLLTRAESAELGTVAAIGDTASARAHCKHLAGRKF